MNNRRCEHLLLVVGLADNNGLTVFVDVVLGSELTLDKEYTHATFDVGACCTRHQHTAFTIECYLDVGLTVLVKARGRIGHALTRDNDVALEPLGHALPCFTTIFKLLTLRERRIRLRYKPELQVCYFSKDSLGFSGILDTGKLYNDAVTSLPLNQGLRDT